jgi:aryl-alcohol dehydrogenase-like predicted oxidoreductase
MDRQQMGKTPVFWIHIPPLKNAFLAEKKMGELGRLGVSGYSRVQDDDKWNNAISMGFFHDVEDAQRALAALRAKGVRSAVIGARNLDQVEFVLRSPSDEDASKLRILEKEFPGSEIKTSRCAP